MKNIISILVITILMVSCGVEKTVTLPNGKVISEKKYYKTLDKAFTKANKRAIDKSSSKPNVTFKEVTIDVATDTTLIK